MIKSRIFSAFALVAVAGFTACADEPTEDAIIEENVTIEEPEVEVMPLPADTMTTDPMMMDSLMTDTMSM